MILYDLTALQPHKNAPAHGGGKFAEVVLYRMLERKVRFCGFYDSSRTIKRNIVETLNKNSISLYDINKDSLDNIMNTLESPLIFSILPQVSYLKYPTIGTIHDCREICNPIDINRFRLSFGYQDIKEFFMQMLCPKMFKKRRINRLLRYLKNPNFTPTTITNYTKYTIYEVLKDESYLEMPIYMTPSYYEPYQGELPLRDNKYALMVSANRWIKNPVRAIRAMDEIFDYPQMKSYKFVIVGLKSRENINVKIKNIENFIFKDYVSEEELTNLYKNCSFLLFPSLYEGFGMPPIEAMCYGKPVIASSLSAIPEICQEGAIYVNAYDVNDMKCKILNLMTDQNTFLEYQKKSIQRFTTIYKKQTQDLDNYIDFVVKKNNENNR